MGKNGKTMEPASVLKPKVIDIKLSLFRAAELSMVVIFDFMPCLSFIVGGNPNLFLTA